MCIPPHTQLDTETQTSPSTIAAFHALPLTSFTLFFLESPAQTNGMSVHCRRNSKMGNINCFNPRIFEFLNSKFSTIFINLNWSITSTCLTVPLSQTSHCQWILTFCDGLLFFFLAGLFNVLTKIRFKVIQSNTTLRCCYESVLQMRLKSIINRT